MICIALVGYGGTGKDEVGRLLVDMHGFNRFAKGDYIKKAVEYVDPWVRIGKAGGGADGGWYPDEHAALSDLLDRERRGEGTRHGLGFAADWLAVHDAVKMRYPDLRRYQQRIADAVVKVCGIDPWTIAMWNDIDASGKDRVVMTRMCLPIEARTWKARGGVVWRINRPGYGPANADPNEVALDDWGYDHVIDNDGDLDRLAKRVDHALSVAEVQDALGVLLGE